MAHPPSNNIFFQARILWPRGVSLSFSLARWTAPITTDITPQQAIKKLCSKYLTSRTRSDPTSITNPYSIGNSLFLFATCFVFSPTVCVVRVFDFLFFRRSKQLKRRRSQHAAETKMGVSTYQGGAPL